MVQQSSSLTNCNLFRLYDTIVSYTMSNSTSLTVSRDIQGISVSVLPQMLREGIVLSRLFVRVNDANFNVLVQIKGEILVEISFHVLVSRANAKRRDLCQRGNISNNKCHKLLRRALKHRQRRPGRLKKDILTGSEIAPSWSPMRLKIQYWRPEFHNWSPVGDLPLSSEPFANRCLTFYRADVFEIKMKGVCPLTTSITSHAATFFRGSS